LTTSRHKEDRRDDIGAGGPRERTVQRLLEAQAERDPDVIAIVAPGRAPLTYGQLCTQVQGVVRTLNEMGIGRNDRVAIVLPNGPEMAAAFVAVAAGATSAPLNPAYRSSEFDFYLTDLNARALIVQSGMDTAARTVAQARGIPIVELSPCLEQEAGLFVLAGADNPSPARGGFAQPDDVALVLHTSGTTSRPKIVPLTHNNICASAHNIRGSLELTDRDRCLNVMPLFHIHGLIGATLASLSAGASIVCTPGFRDSEFLGWVEAFHPTWYTAVPTMHQAVLARAADYREVIARCPLRLIRSSSASLPARVMAQLEDIFGVPVIESYGMTEASHQMTSNPLPPRPRKPGSVGLAAGPEVAIMDEGGELLPQGQAGEIVIRGESVTRGYENNPAANESAFTHGWFRTGDEGRLDSDGYLFITGRLKEMINRGGEKVAPREVDEAFLDHPAVEQAVTFAVPHATLGEDVATAIVLRKGAAATEKEMRSFAFARLADYKVPTQVLIVDRVPKGPTGKLQRIGLAEKLEAELKAEFVPPRDAVEETLTEIWAEVLQVQEIGVRDNFFALGGDSLLAARLFAEMEKATNQKLPLAALFRAPTIEQLAEILRSRMLHPEEDWSDLWTSLVPVQPEGSKPPFFCVHGHSGNVLFCRDLARYLGPDQPFYAFQRQGLDGQRPFHTRIEEMAAHYVKEMRLFQPQGPYYLGGFCIGGAIAFEMAQQLHGQGERVAVLALLDAVNDLGHPDLGLAQAFRLHVRNLARLDFRERLAYVVLKGRSLAETIKNWLQGASQASSAGRAANLVPPPVERDYVPRVYPGQMTLFRGTDKPVEFYVDPYCGWRGLAAGGIEVHHIRVKQGYITKEPYVRVTAEKLRACLDEAQVAAPVRAEVGGG
jgi:acyl-CoA synthetase (AMP-forming)/AMP-acid ligase II/thioesterase domain-containing protein/acyl carrier protein